MARPPKPPTWTKVVLDCLRAADDFVPFSRLLECAGCTRNLLTATLHHLRLHKTADSVVGGDGQLWWFATGDDDRERILDERTPEVKPRAPRRCKAKYTPGVE